MKIMRLSRFATGRAAGLLPVLTLLSACAGMDASMQDTANSFRLTSLGLSDNAMLAQKHAGNNKANQNCVGSNVSPTLQWSNAPENTRSFAIVMDDQAGRAGLGVSHWVAYGIPADITSLAEGEVSGPSKNVVGGKNTGGTTFYAGPCPPLGNAPQHYTFTLIATNLEPDALKPGLTKTELVESLKGHTLRATSLVLRYAH